MTIISLSSCVNLLVSLLITMCPPGYFWTKLFLAREKIKEKEGWKNRPIQWISRRSLSVNDLTWIILWKKAKMWFSCFTHQMLLIRPLCWLFECDFVFLHVFSLVECYWILYVFLTYSLSWPRWMTFFYYVAARFEKVKCLVCRVKAACAPAIRFASVNQELSWSSTPLFYG